MKKFLKRIVLFCGLIIVILIPAVFVFFVRVLPQHLESYNASLLDKVQRLKNLNEAKIVLIGNSNVAFGFQSNLIEEAYDMPVVNMGLHGGLGNAFHEKMAKINVHEGDIYVICHHTFLDDGMIEDVQLAWLTLENHIELWQLADRRDIIPMCEGLPYFMKKTIFDMGLELIGGQEKNREVTDVYSRKEFNQYGDVASLREKSIFTFEEQSLPEINDTCIERLNELNTYLNARGATMVVAGYPIGKGEFTPAEDEFVLFQEMLKEQLDCEVISDYRDYMFDYSYFYNTFLHLTTDGARLRTEQLIKDLEKVIDDTY